MQVQLPFMTKDGQLAIPSNTDFVVESITLLEVDRTVSVKYVSANEIAVPNIFQRTIYRKGATESVRIGMVLIDLSTGLYTLKVDDPLMRPAGLDIQLTLKLTAKEQS